MWEDEYKRNFMRRIILIALIVVILGGLAAAMLVVHKRTERQDAQLVEAYTQQQEKQTAARQEAVDAINAEYEKDMQTVREYLPGIVCWGDSITAGSSGNVSYPYVLQKYIDAYICDIYDFRSSIDNAEDYARLKWDDYKVDIPVALRACFLLILILISHITPTGISLPAVRPAVRNRSQPEL